MKHTTALLSLLCLLAMLTACGDSKTLARPKAAKMIADFLSEHNRRQDMNLDLRQGTWDADYGPNWQATPSGKLNPVEHWFYNNGYVKFSAELLKPQPWGFVSRARYTLTLTDEGRNALRDWKRTSDPSPTVIQQKWTATVANPVIDEVTGIHHRTGLGGASGDNEAVVEFKFHMSPTKAGTELSQIPRRPGSIRLPDPNKTYTGDALFRLYDDGWRLAGVEMDWDR